MKITLMHFIVLIAVLLFDCQTASSEKYKQLITSNTMILKTTLSSLNIDDPEKDIQINIKNNDLRFICVCGYSCYTPGVEKDDLLLTEKYGVRCLEGTSDVFDSVEHVKLIMNAKGYAEHYNGSC